MSWNPNQGQDPNQPEQQSGYQAGGYQQQDPYQQGQPGGYQQQGPYQQGQPGGYQQQGPYQQGGNYQQPFGAPYTVPPNPNGPTSMGMDANVAAGLSYLIPLIGGLIFYFGEKQNRFVRFHAMQSILLYAAWTVLFVVFTIIQSILYASIILIPVGFVFSCAAFVLLPIVGVGLAIVLMIYGFQGKYIKLPIIGDYAEKYAAPTM
jgi:uncharacterized membrane protein